MAPSTATIRKQAGVAIMDFSGVLMIGESSALFRRIVGELMGMGCPRIILNFQELTALDSAGIGELVAAYTLMKAKGMRLKLLSPRQKVRDVLKLTSLSNVFDVYADEEIAFRSFDKP
jgi:anti-sigma B factor antagonist